MSKYRCAHIPRAPQSWIQGVRLLGTTGLLKHPDSASKSSSRLHAPPPEASARWTSTKEQTLTQLLVHRHKY